MLDQWRTERRWSMQRYLGDVQRLCSELFAGINPEHSLPLETERAPSTDVRQEKSAVTSRHDAAQRAHHAGHRRAVPECGGLSGAWCFDCLGSQLPLGDEASAWHAFEPQEARQVLEDSPEQ